MIHFIIIIIIIIIVEMFCTKMTIILWLNYYLINYLFCKCVCVV